MLRLRLIQVGVASLVGRALACLALGAMTVQRQPNRKTTANTHRASYGDAATVQLGDTLGDRQP